MYLLQVYLGLHPNLCLFHFLMHAAFMSFHWQLISPASALTTCGTWFPWQWYKTCLCMFLIQANCRFSQAPWNSPVRPSIFDETPVSYRRGEYFSQNSGTNPGYQSWIVTSGVMIIVCYIWWYGDTAQGQSWRRYRVLIEPMSGPQQLGWSLYLAVSYMMLRNIHL